MEEKWMPDENLRVGTIVEVDGSKILVELDASISELTRVYKTDVYSIGQVGSIIKVHFGRKLLFAFVTRLRMQSEIESSVAPARVGAGRVDTRVLEAEVFGEGQWDVGEDGRQILEFQRGVGIYPLPKQGAYLTSVQELAFIYENRSGATAPIGEYVGAEAVPCLANLDELFSKHAAVLGSTGAGKSCAVVSLLRAALSPPPGEQAGQGPWHPQVVVLDPHNEYGQAFPEATRLVSDEGTLRVPYWLLNLSELLDLVIGKTEFQATRETNIVKKALLAARREGAPTIQLDPDGITVDSPVPFSISRLSQLIRSDMPKQESRQTSHQSILNKIDALQRDRRLDFLMEDWDPDSKSDDFVRIVRQFIDPQVHVKIVDLSGVPTDVAGAVSAVVARLLFMYKLWESHEERARDPVLLVCEEAHRYVPERGEAEYATAQSAIRRLAKEGRKYGLGLILVSQRPSEIDGTVLSQCSSWIVLRLTNSRDQEYVQRFLPDSLAGLARLLPSLRRQEAVFLGQAAQIPARIRISTVPNDRLPRSLDISFVEGWRHPPHADSVVKEVARRWRLQVRAVSEGASE